MIQYIDLVNTILTHGVHKPNRTGVDTLAYFAYPFRHDLSWGFPLLTTKDMSGPLWNSMIKELLWFISGENHIRNFKNESHIWDAWADEQGNLETAYGFYWRNFPYAFNGKMIRWSEVGSPTDEMIEAGGDGILLAQQEKQVWLNDECGVGNFDQLAFCVNKLKDDPNNRRLVVSAWEPYNAHKSKLPPCHLLYIFNVQDGRLCLHMTQRSCDVGLGVPFNIASYALLNHIIAQETGLEPGILSIIFVDAHIYYAPVGHEKEEFDHSRVLAQQAEREPYDLPRIRIADKPWDQLKFEDFELLNYQSHPRLKMKVAV
jgi:thymidylate synthase